MNWIRDLLQGRKAAPVTGRPVQRTVIEPPQLYRLLMRQFAGRWHGGEATIRHSDRAFYLPTPDEAKECIRKAWTPYVEQVDDCDDAAFAAKHQACVLGRHLGKPVAFGIAWTTKPDHAINWYVHEGMVRFLDVRALGEVKLEGELTLMLC
jgi:hypothetical protein